ncbi:hypothetical protein D7231_20690 [Streptomyces klenkii]|uniref:Uncharacterized protein n=1 Tax=Streptomyces klenkii TaxID=1420899 RepID=A0A3B0BCV7_9ACTN|nr:hypothetical protein D7231_20690 [Streptomyces klenkii]
MRENVRAWGRESAARIVPKASVQALRSRSTSSAPVAAPRTASAMPGSNSSRRPKKMSSFDA